MLHISFAVNTPVPMLSTSLCALSMVGSGHVLYSCKQNYDNKNSPNVHDPTALLHRVGHQVCVRVLIRCLPRDIKVRGPFPPAAELTPKKITSKIRIIWLIANSNCYFPPIGIPAISQRRVPCAPQKSPTSSGCKTRPNTTQYCPTPPFRLHHR